MMQRASLCSIGVLIVIFVSVSEESYNKCFRARLCVHEVGVAAGLGVESSPVESCDIDVEDARVDELEGPFDKP